MLNISKIFLVRHGQTDANLNHVVQGQSDTPLNENGIRQAKDVASKLKNVNAEVVISSDLKRARQTAEIISRTCGLPLILDERLREMKLGLWEGKTFEDVMKDPAAVIWSEKPSQWKINGSETLEEVQKRMVAAISEFSKRYETFIVVSHGIAISTFVIFVKKLSLDSMWNYLPDNTAVMEIEMNSSLEKSRVE